MKSKIKKQNRKKMDRWFRRAVGDTGGGMEHISGNDDVIAVLFKSCLKISQISSKRKKKIKGGE